ncbi:hypothetical protein KQX54_007116 [Cotesia glomerata]|uniref:Homeobox domain-containing protein n=1 Tax=Cotesia glomerata TaxID=32391 RepID=A0AAV7IZP2_COTGL|nr:hypothetical protein KQX54_007116 [Cotesia glomerata]
MSKKVLERAYDVRFEIRKSLALMRDMNGVMFCRKLDVEDSEVWFQNRRAKFRRNERSRGASSTRDIETTLPLRPIRIAYTHENTPETLQSPPQVPQYSYSEYWRSSQNYSFVNGNLNNVSFPSYHQSEVHGSIEGTSMNSLSNLRLRSHPYSASYSAMHASM